jgi:peroxiredoxin
MKKVLIPIMLIIIIVSCTTNNSKDSFTINGTITGEVPEFLYLYYNEVQDTARIENGHFEFTGKVDYPLSAYLVIPNISVMVDDYFYLENENMMLEISVENKIMKNMEVHFIKIDSISGSKTELMRREFQRFEQTNSTNSDWNAILFKNLDSIISKNPKNDFSGDVLISQIKKESLNQQQITNLFQKIDTTLLSNIKLEKIKRAVFPELTLMEGKQLYDFNLPNATNELISTKEFRGKILLIEFWASWCAPCRKTIPALLEVYNEYKSDGFEVLGVSFDMDTEKWKRAIEKDNIIWTNVVDTLAFEGKVATKYNISGIPNNYLIDQNGTILAKNISVENLKEYLNKN